MANGNARNNGCWLLYAVVPLTVLFVGLRLGGVISWAWWWVLCPLWLTALFYLYQAALALLAVRMHKPDHKRDAHIPAEREMKVTSAGEPRSG
jgi:hypothetical protein